MHLNEFDFDLPESLIALRPARPRESARLLHVPSDDGPFEDHEVRDLPRLLREGDVLVFNDSRTIPAALMGYRAGRGQDPAPVGVPINLHMREGPDTWRAFARKAKRLAIGDVLTFGGDTLSASVVRKSELGEVSLQFSASGAALDVLIAGVGTMPLPPYIASKREIDADDASDYQTLHAKHDGSVATPTAGLHFTPALRSALEGMGVDLVHVTLHVGAGTFLPVKTEDVSQHVMHQEHWSIEEGTAARLNAARASGRRIIAVGTTSLRTLESAVGSDGMFRAGASATSIFITPGYKFKCVDGLLTNFHLPKSTLMMLVSAFAGHERTKAVYRHAIAQQYRFYSYGDASLFWRSQSA
jgi:S-adenosylmethionine:tRNA ribosyltransferase-isomerase